MSNRLLGAGGRTSQHLGKFWTVANMLSLLRVLLTIPITYLILVDGAKTWIFALIGVALLTDWFDGRVARWSHTVSDWGKVLDPLADKLAAAAVTLALTVRDVLPVWFLGSIVARDAVIVLGGVIVARRTGKVLMSLWLGKVAVTALAVTVLAALLEADPPVLQACLWTTTVLMAVAFLLYLIRFVQVFRTGAVPPEAGLQQSGTPSVSSVQQEAGSMG
jgi:CDP-diacylglycerol--glycerol-3-phosphate 3-phosphatidyltransferase